MIKNFGTGVAQDIKIKDFDYSIVSKNFLDNVKKSFVARGIPSLVPSARRDTIILAGPADMQGREEQEGHITLTYKESTLTGRLKEREASFVLDMYSLAGSVYTTSDEHIAANALKDIAKRNKEALNQQKAIARTLKSIADAQNNEENTPL